MTLSRKRLATLAASSVLIATPVTMTTTVPAEATGATVPIGPTSAASAPRAPTDAAPSSGRRGSLLRLEPVASLSTAGARNLLRRGHWGDAVIDGGVNAYRLTYATVDVDGRPTRATGLLTLPASGNGSVRAVAYGHGTSSYRGAAPSAWPEPYTVAPGVVIAGNGMAGVLPDYLGLGGGPGQHPWMHVPSERTAAVDMLRAADAAAARLGRPLLARVDVTGFSQGASVGLALTRALADGWLGRLRPGRVIVTSGAYALRDVQLPAMLAGRGDRATAVIYAAFALVAWRRIAPIYGDLREVVRAPYAGRLRTLFDSDTDANPYEQLPATIDELVTPAGRALLDRPNAPLRRILGLADSVCRWHSPVPITLLAARDDEQAFAGNTTTCAARLSAAGHPVRTVDLGTPEVFGSRHLGTNVAGTIRAVRLFAGAGRVSPSRG